MNLNPSEAPVNASNESFAPVSGAALSNEKARREGDADGRKGDTRDCSRSVVAKRDAMAPRPDAAAQEEAVQSNRFRRFSVEGRGPTGIPRFQDPNEPARRDLGIDLHRVGRGPAPRH